MLVRIKSCSDTMLWYADQVGELYRCNAVDALGYWTRTQSGYINVIRHEDAEPLESEQ